MQSHGPWKIKKTNEIYRDPFVEVTRDDVIRPDGLDGQHVVVTLKPGICVLAFDSKWNVHLTDEFHYGIGRNSIEAVSGGVEPGENPDETAKRELAEELGLAAKSWEYLTTVDPFTTVLTSPTRLYFANDLSEVQSAPEGTELIDHRVFSCEECYQKVIAGEITHTPTCILILLAYQRMRGI